MSVCSYYEVLMVTRDAAPEVIRAAYKALSQKWHPDRNTHEKAPEIMVLLNNAYEALSDPTRRREYDDWLADEERPTKSSAFEVDENKARPVFAEIERRSKWRLSPLQKRILLALITGGILGGLT